MLVICSFAESISSPLLCFSDLLNYQKATSLFKNYPTNPARSGGLSFGQSEFFPDITDIRRPVRHNVGKAGLDRLTHLNFLVHPVDAFFLLP
jgi:hypothetical protein